jgi:REP element-mobilizing transposase RayT
MSSLLQVYLHITFHTKDNASWLSLEREEEILDFMGGAFLKMGCRLIQGGGYDNHIHLLVKMSPKCGIEEVVRRIKGSSSYWIRRRWPELSAAGWQHGYAAFSINYSNMDPIIHYIKEQRTHHQQG